MLWIFGFHELSEKSRILCNQLAFQEAFLSMKTVNSLLCVTC